MRQQLLFFLIVLAIPLTAVADKAEPLPYNPSVARSAAIASASGFLGSGANPFAVHVPAQFPDLTSEIPGVQKSGIVYPLPSPVTPAQLSWETVNGRLVSRIRVVTENAKGLRLHVRFDGRVAPIQFRVQGALDGTPLGPITDTAIRNGEIWLPVTHGDSADLEISIAQDQSPATLGLSLDQVTLIMLNVSGASPSAILPKSLGLAQEQESDLACWASDSAYPALQSAAAGTALINFIQNDTPYLCTGTLLNDRGNTQTPWFATANHCIPDQATADTMDFEWLFQATVCAGRITDSRHTQTIGGAQLLWTEASREASFLKLSQPPGANSVFSGWDTQIQLGDRVWGVHHPEGDHTMVSRGKVTILKQTIQDVSQGGTHVLDEIVYDNGGTEVGSSGSGLFAVADGKAYWKGTLFGGPAANYRIADYSHFQGYYDVIKKWLGSCLLPWGGTVTDGSSVTAYATTASANCKTAAETRNCAGGALSGSYTNETCVSSGACTLPWGGSIANGKTVTAYQAATNADCAALAQTRTCSQGELNGSYTYSTCVSPQACPTSWDGSAPVADPGGAGTANLGERYQLDGSHSCNALPDVKKAIRYAWKPVLAPVDTNGVPAKFHLSRARTARPRFVPPLPGDYTFQLSVANRRLSSQPERVTVHVGGVIQVAAASESGLWTLGDDLPVTWTFSGINPTKRFNLLLLTDVGAETSKRYLLKKNVKPIDTLNGSYSVRLNRSPRHLKIMTAQAAIKVCLPPVGKNEPVCGTSALFSIR